MLMNIKVVLSSFFETTWLISTELCARVPAQKKIFVSFNKKDIDTTVRERPQTLLVPSKEICKHVLCNIHI